MKIDEFLSHFESPKKTENCWMVRCPAHNDHKPSLSIAEGDDGRVMVKCHAGCKTEDIVSSMGLKMTDLFCSAPVKRKSSVKQSFSTNQAAIASLEKQIGGQATNRWLYTRKDQSEAFWIIRIQDENGQKHFRPIHKTANGWVCRKPQKQLPLYRLPQILNAHRVIVAEGEKAADMFCSLGFNATTSAFGANAEKSTDWSVLAGMEVIIFPDADAAGEKYAKSVTQLLANLEPDVKVKIVNIPDLPDKGDIVDFIADREGMSQNANIAEIESLIADSPWIELDEEGDRAVLQCMADIQPKKLEWLWKNRIPLGKVTLLMGDPGLGKSFLTLDIASQVSTGTPFIDEPTTIVEEGSVILLSAEDDPEDTIRPRLDSAEANVKNVHILKCVKRADEENPFSLDLDIPLLEQTIKQMKDVRLVIIDPISAYLGNTDSHKNADIRRVLTPLAELASRYCIAVLGITHMNKSGGQQAIYRSLGSIAFTALARAAWLVIKDKDNEFRRLMLPVKMNLTQSMTGLAYSIVDQVVEWEPDPIQLSADEALSIASGHANEDKKSAIDEAKEWLQQELSYGPLESGKVIEEAKYCGIAKRTLERAKIALGVVAKKQGYHGGWQWKLPENQELLRRTPKIPEDGQSNCLASFEKVGALREAESDERESILI